MLDAIHQTKERNKLPPHSHSEHVFPKSTSLLQISQGQRLEKVRSTKHVHEFRKQWDLQSQTSASSFSSHSSFDLFQHQELTSSPILCPPWCMLKHTDDGLVSTRSRETGVSPVFVRVVEVTEPVPRRKLSMLTKRGAQHQLSLQCFEVRSNVWCFSALATNTLTLSTFLLLQIVTICACMERHRSTRPQLSGQSRCFSLNRSIRFQVKNRNVEL